MNVLARYTLTNKCLKSPVLQAISSLFSQSCPSTITSTAPYRKASISKHNALTPNTSPYFSHSAPSHSTPSPSTQVPPFSPPPQPPPQLGNNRLLVLLHRPRHDDISSKKQFVSFTYMDRTIYRHASGSDDLGLVACILAFRHECYIYTYT